MVPSNYVLKYDNKSITETVAGLSIEISKYLNKLYKQENNSTTKPPIIVNVLKGGTIFYTTLVTQLDTSFPIELGNIAISSYENNVTSGNIKILYKDFNPQGRIVVLVDDIFDSGKTLLEAAQYLTERGASKVILVALIYRLTPKDSLVFYPTYCGFQYFGDEWFVGFGMDDNGLYRNLPDIYIIK